MQRLCDDEDGISRMVKSWALHRSSSASSHLASSVLTDTPPATDSESRQFVTPDHAFYSSRVDSEHLSGSDTVSKRNGSKLFCI